MKELNENEINEISGGKFKLRVNLGAVIGGAVVGFISGGPVGLGLAIGTAVITQSVNSLDDMVRNGEPF